jgi:hypothetical protein
MDMCYVWITKLHQKWRWHIEDHWETKNKVEEPVEGRYTEESREQLDTDKVGEFMGG